MPHSPGAGTVGGRVQVTALAWVLALVTLVRALGVAVTYELLGDRLQVGCVARRSWGRRSGCKSIGAGGQGAGVLEQKVRGRRPADVRFLYFRTISYISA